MMGPIEAVTSAMGEVLTELDGFRSTRLRAAPTPGRVVLRGSGNASSSDAGVTVTLPATPELVSLVQPGMVLQTLDGDFVKQTGTAASRKAAGPELLHRAVFEKKLIQPAAGFGTSLTASGRLTAARPTFRSDMVGQAVTVWGGDSANWGTFLIDQFVSPTQVDLDPGGATLVLDESVFPFTVEGVEGGDRLVVAGASVDAVIAFVEDTLGIRRTEARVLEELPAFFEETWSARGALRDAIVLSTTSTSITLGGLGLREDFAGVSWQIIDTGDFHLDVETTKDWPSVGELRIERGQYRYSGLTADQVLGVEWFDGVHYQVGVQSAHPPQTEVVEANRSFSKIDELRRQTQLDTATGENLSAIGRELSLPRPPTLRDDEIYRAVLKAVAYCPRGTLLCLWELLDAAVGPTRYQVFEDFTVDPLVRRATVYLRIIETVAPSFVGRTFLDGGVLATSTSRAAVDLGASALFSRIQSIRLAPEPAIVPTTGRETHQGSRLAAFGSQATSTGGFTTSEDPNAVLVVVDDTTRIQPGDVFQTRGVTATVLAVYSSTELGIAPATNGTAPISGIYGGPIRTPQPVTLGVGIGAIARGNAISIIAGGDPLPRDLAVGDRVEILTGIGGPPLGAATVTVPDPNGITALDIPLPQTPLPYSLATSDVWRVTRGLQPFAAQPWKVYREQTNCRYYDPTDDLFLEPGSVAAWSAVAGGGTRTPGEYIEITQSLVDAEVGYRHALRATSEAEVDFEAMLGWATSTGLSETDGRQLGLRIRDTLRVIQVGIIKNPAATTARMDFVDAVGAFIQPTGGVQFDLAAPQTVALRIQKTPTQVRLWADGVCVQSVPYETFPLDTRSAGSRTPDLQVGSFIVSLSAAPVMQVRQLAWRASDPQEFWNARHETTTLLPPRTVTTSGAFFDAGDVGKPLRIVDSPLLATGGAPIGTWVIDSVVSSTEVTVRGALQSRGAFTGADRRAFVSAGTDRPFVWPDMLGASVEILGNHPNAGTYIIEAILDDETFQDVGLTPEGADRAVVTHRASYVGTTGDVLKRIRTRTVLLDVLSNTTLPGGLFDISVGEVEWRVIPLFPATGATQTIELSDVGTVSGTVLSMTRGGLPADVPAVTLLEVRRSVVPSAQLLRSTERNAQPAHPGADFYPFYLYDGWGWLRRFLPSIVAAGVHPDFDQLTSDGNPVSPNDLHLCSCE